MGDKDDLEALGEQLYPLIHLKHQENAAKLTGMLLELPGPVLVQMLQDQDLLCEALEKAVRALQDQAGGPACQDDDDASASSDSLGEQLFQLVDALNTGHSHKITGMLLEQHREAVLKLLTDSRLLDQQVQLALKTLEERGDGEDEDGSDTTDGDDAERLGEELFVLVEEMEPLHANSITGMLLEMDPAALRQLISDGAVLGVAVQKARAALDPRS